MIIKKGQFINKQIFFIVLLVVLSAFLFFISHRFQEQFAEIMGVASYLTWHIIFESVSIIISFSIFFISFYTYDQTRILRSLLLGCIFFVVGFVDFLHVFSYKGMPAFFIETAGANTPTTYWIIGRLYAAIGFVIAFSLNEKKKIWKQKNLFFIPAVILSVLIFYIVAFKPGFLPVMYDDAAGLTQIKKILEYVVMLLFLVTIILNFRTYKKTKNEVYIIFAYGLMLGVISEIAFVLYKNDVYNIYNYLGHIYKAVSFMFIFNAIFIHDIRKPYEDLKNTKDELSVYAENLDKLVETRTKMLKYTNAKLLKNLDYAREIQKSMMPREIPAIKDFEIKTGYFPAEHVTGDFYNIFKLDRNKMAFYLGDVSGHGVPAAMLSVFLNQSIKVISEYNMESMLNPAYVLNEVYAAFNRTNFTEDVYSVLIYGVIDTNEMMLTLSSAGLNVSPLIMREKQIDEIKIPGMPIIKFGEYITPFYENKLIELKKGDTLYFYTDGLVEARNSKGIWYGEERMKRVLKINEGKDLIDISGNLEDDVFGHIGKNEIYDDITYIFFRI